jgi:peptide/nickel transport system permease protein
MFLYVLKRILLTIPILFAVVFLVFTIMYFTPGDPARTMLGVEATPEAIEALRHKLGVDQPFFPRFMSYITNIVTKFDFGVSYRTMQPVAQELLVRFPTTLQLAVTSIVVSATFGVSIGVLAAIRQYSKLDISLTVLALFFAAIPGFWLALMLILIFAVRLGWLPTSGFGTWKHMILPTITLSIGGIAGIMRITRSAMLETIRQDYIRTARAKGVVEKVVIWRHAIRNALMPVITVLGLEFAGLLGGAIIAETIFNVPGVGAYVVAGIREKNAPVVLSSTILLASTFCLIVLILDIIYALIDPRVKARFIK